MSTKKNLYFKKRIAPPYLKTSVVLVLFLSSIVFSPMFVYSSQGSEDESFLNLKIPLIKEETALLQEKLSLIAGKDKSVIATFLLDGGEIATLFDLSLPVFSSVTQFDFIISNQSSFGKIWTNPLWQFPDGLVIRITTRTSNIDRIQSIITYVSDLVEYQYQLSLSIYNIQYTETGGAIISLVASFYNTNVLQIFSDIFSPYDTPTYGNMVSVLGDILGQSPPLYAFGYTLMRSLGSVNRIIRSAIVGLENAIKINGNLHVFNTSSVFGVKIEPNPSVYTSTFSYQLPFYANITSIYPLPDNFASQLTGTFEWILKYLTFTKYENFNAEIVYNPNTPDEFNYPKVVATQSYSDQLLENSGILNMTYNVKNVGNEAAYNTSIIFPIPSEFESLVLAGLEVPILNETLTINESFSSFVNLEIDYSIYHLEIPVLDVRGWYEYISNASLARWIDDTSFELNEYVTVLCSNGISSDLYNAVITRIQPILDTYDIAEILLYHIPLVEEQLTLAVEEAYTIAFTEFYDNKTLFNFSSSNFSYVTNIFGGYLECEIPYLGVGESVKCSWKLNDIPTASDVFGAFSIFTEFAGQDEYAVFQTSESNYQTLMITLFASMNNPARFLSVYEPSLGAFISLGNRYIYYDANGMEYFGLTNGINLQIGDDEAVLESSLNTDQTIYRVGDTVSFELNISNYGTIDAYDIHVDIINIKFNYLWHPTDIVVVKSFEIDQINSGEELSREFSILANSYIGLNSYIALISFTSDKEQTPTEIENPWTGGSIFWIFGGETRNIVSSTLSFGILLPPISLQNQIRPSFPLPEISISTLYSLSENEDELYVEYTITNEGLSDTNVSIYQILDPSKYTLDSVNCSYYHDLVNPQVLTPLFNVKQAHTIVSFANVTLSPGDYIVISETYTNLSGNFTIPPLVVNYKSIYQIYITEYEEISSPAQEQSSETSNLLVKMSPSNITEGSQNIFNWASFSFSIYISIPISEEYTKITFSPLHYIYPLISIGIVTSVVLVVMLISRIRRRY
ncbi:MAG: hypothetical protein ACFFDS_00830 [Candidatus Thorarchaeota archaeon]